MDKPFKWANGDLATEKQKKAIDLLRQAGCKCQYPLLGERPGVGPRCRSCNTQAKEVK